MPTTYHCGSYREGSNLTVEDTVTDWCGEFVTDYDIDVFADLYREQINKNLADSVIVLHGNEFYGEYPAISSDAYVIATAIGSITDDEMTAMAQKAERGNDV